MGYKGFCSICKRSLYDEDECYIIGGSKVCKDCLYDKLSRYLRDKSNMEAVFALLRKNELTRLAETPRDGIDDCIKDLVPYYEAKVIFSSTLTISPRIQFDDNNKLLMVAPKNWNLSKDYIYPLSSFQLFRYDQIEGFETYEQSVSSSSTRCGVGRAIAGGLLFGPIGAVVGGMTANRETNLVCIDLGVRLFLDDDSEFMIGTLEYYHPNVGSDSYNEGVKVAKAVCKKLSQITNTPEKGAVPPVNTSSNTIDPVSEIRRYKALLDDGIITQAEFEAKKKQLLDLPIGCLNPQKPN